MKSIDKYIKEKFSLLDVFEQKDFIIEGININDKSKTVSLTDKHSSGVDFNLVNSPIYYNVDGIDVISIFKRTKLNVNNVERDGNPFIYALKEKYGWTFDISDKEIIKYIRRFLSVCNKIKSHYDVVIAVPSKSIINEKFLNVIYNKVDAELKIKDYFTKLIKEEIIDQDYINIEKIKQDYKDKYSDVIDDILTSFKKMKTEYFEAKYINKNYLKYIKYIGNSDTGSYFDKFNNKDILILDAILSSGETISQCVKNIKETFSPKSITVITLLSKVLNF